MSKNNKMSLLAISCILVFSKAAFAFAAEPVSSVLSNSSKPTPPTFAANASAPQHYLQQEGSGVTKYPTWHVSLESTQATTLPTPTVAARTTSKVYVAAGNQVFVIDPSSADHKPTLLCTLPKVGQVAIQAPPALSLNEDTLYVSYSNKVYAINLNPNDPQQKVGGIVWIFNGGDLYSSIVGFSGPQVDPITGMIFVTKINSFNYQSVYCIDSSGHTSLLFKSYPPAKGYAPDFFKWELAPDGKGGVISVAYDDGRNPYINAYVKDNYNWWSDAEAYVKFTSPALDKGRNKVYVGGSDGYLYVYNNEANRGNIRGPSKISLTTPPTDSPTNTGFQSAPAVATDGTVYIGDVNGYLYAVNANGQKKWAIKPSPIPDATAPFQFKTRPVVYRNDNNKNIIYIVDASGALFAVQDNGASGAVVWKNYSIQAASTPALLSNGDNVTVIVSTLLGEVAAFEGGK